MSDTKYWASLNEMLQKDEIEFDQPTKSSALPLNLIFKSRESIKKGVEFALKNFNEIAKLEYEFNDGQPAKATIKHLQWAKVYIESKKSVLKPTSVSVVNAQSIVSVGQFLLDCHYVATQSSLSEFKIQTDTKRKTLITYLFGNEFIEEVNTTSAPLPNEFKLVDTSSTQIIFESGDVTSALDELIMNVYDRTLSPWRIRSVYIEETLKNSIWDLLKSAANNIIGPKLTEENMKNCEELTKRFGGKFVNGFLLDVPTKYLPQPTKQTDFNQIPVVINFFRTTKEAIQLVNADVQPDVKHITSIWTGNIEIYYELAAELNAEVIWSNSIAVFDDAIPSLTSTESLLDSEQISSATSTINTKGKYAVHVLQTANKTPKYLYIPFGKTFAN
ncbi:uncharacterized protein LOC129570343 [Sitodiplosis mosellana]|uniref:uncharacterized protein LOC129570343 n=1 Tax=Sitodiplosis mosellana TaxID=263140 RepID=UPI002443D4AA|nr:uncharacterized protein LOC129570343 [Sitodiplosis mosellana]